MPSCYSLKLVSPLCPRCHTWALTPGDCVWGQGLWVETGFSKVTLVMSGSWSSGGRHRERPVMTEPEVGPRQTSPPALASGLPHSSGVQLLSGLWCDKVAPPEKQGKPPPLPRDLALESWRALSPWNADQSFEKLTPSLVSLCPLLPPERAALSQFLSSAGLLLKLRD